MPRMDRITKNNTQFWGDSSIDQRRSAGLVERQRSPVVRPYLRGRSHHALDGLMEA